MGRLKLLRGNVNPIRAKWERLSRRVRRALLAVQLLSLLIYAIYLVYEIATGAFIVFKSILLAATMAYGIFYTIQHDKIDKPSRAKRKIGKRIYTFIKIIVKGCTLALTFYGLFAATVTTTFWSVTLAIAMLIIWIFSLFFEIVSWLVDRRVTKLRRMAEEKYNNAKNLVTSSVNETKNQVKTKIKNAEERITNGINDTKAKVSDGYHEAKTRITDGYNKTVSQVTEACNDAKERVTDGIERAKEQVTDAAHEAKERVTDGIERAKDEITKATIEAREKARVGAEKVKSALSHKKNADTLPESKDDIPLIDAPADSDS